MITRFITTRIESIARSAARRPRYAPAHPQLFRSCLTTTRGGHIAAVCFRHQSPPDLYFATHTQGRKLLVGFEPTKAFLCFVHGRSGPAQSHRGRTPGL